MSEFDENKKLVLDTLKQKSKPPILTVPIARKLGIAVYNVRQWDDKWSGMIKKDEDDGGESGYAIYVNNKHSEPRRRFTIAHEIAHYVLHKNLIGDGIVDDALYRSGLSSLIETEANRFAAQMLMPKHLLEQAIRNERAIEKLTKNLARQFNVSIEAMAIQLHTEIGYSV